MNWYKRLFILEAGRKYFTYSWVSGVIFRNVPLNFANKVSAHVGSLGVDSTSDPSKQRHGRSTEAVPGDGLEQALPIVAVVELEQVDGDVEHEEAVGREQEAHDRAGAERGDEGPADAFPGLERGPCVGVGGDLHAEEAGDDGGDGTEGEGDGAEEGVEECGLARLPAALAVGGAGVRRPGAEPLDGAEEDEDDDGEGGHEGADVPVLGEEERRGPLGDGALDLGAPGDDVVVVQALLLLDQRVAERVVVVVVLAPITRPSVVSVPAAKAVSAPICPELTPWS